MSVLIEGMEIPSDGFVEVIIRNNGLVQQTGQSCQVDGKDYYQPYTGEAPKTYTAIPVPTPHGRLIAEADAVETAWMILRGLGYLKEENPMLDQTMREVFATAKAIEVE